MFDSQSQMCFGLARESRRVLINNEMYLSQSLNVFVSKNLSVIAYPMSGSQSQMRFDLALVRSRVLINDDTYLSQF